MKTPRNSEKGDYLKPNTSSGLKKLKQAGGSTKTFPFADGVMVKATYVVIQSGDVESKTKSHTLNPRNQDALTLDAVRDIYPSILNDGISQEGIAIKDRETGRYLLLDSSRRRFCAIKANKDLPLWVLESLTTAQAISLIKKTQDVKKWSWREEGRSFLMVANEHNISEDSYEEIGNIVDLSKETIRKKIQAAKIHADLIQIFPDSEGLPTKFYSKLAKIERVLINTNQVVSEFISGAMKTIKVLDTTDIEAKQVSILTHLEECLAKPKLKGLHSRKENLSTFDDVNKSAKIHVSPNGQNVKFEFKRMKKSVVADIEKYIKSRLKDE